MDDSIQDKVRALVVKRRETLGISQSELGRRADVTRPTITRFENGTHWPRQDALKAILHALDLDLDVSISSGNGAAA